MNVPQVGQQVSVVCKGHSHKPVFVPLYGSWTVSGPDTVTYTGTVVKPDEWMRTDEFNLTTGLSHFPVRTISMTNVLSIDGIEGAPTTTGEEIKVVYVKGSKGNEYEVIVKNGVAETCTCPAFTFRGGRCKHLRMATGDEPEPQAVPTKKASKPSQKRRAKKGSKMEQAKSLYAQHKGVRKSTIEAFKRQLLLTDACASTYYYNIKKVS